MKRFFSLMMLFLAGGALLMTSCSSDDSDENGGGTTSTSPFASVTAKDGSSTLTATVNDTQKTIKFGQFQNMTNLTSVEVTFKMNKGYILKIPNKFTSNVNLMSPFYVTVLVNGKTEETYTMTADVPEMPDPVLGATVNGVKATVADDKSITIKWEEGMEINHMVFELELAEGAKVVSPEDCTFDLEFGEGTLVINYYDEEIVYTVRATDYKDPLLDMGWADVTANFGTLPAYIKVYKTENAGGIENAAAYVVMLGSQAEMACIGDGVKNKKTLDDLENEGDYKVYFVGIDSSLNQIMVRNGEVVQANSSMSGTLGQNEDGSYQMSYANVFDGKVYTIPYRTSGTYEAPTVEKGTLWEPKTAVEGLYYILYEGQIQTADDVKRNQGFAEFFGDADIYARAVIGLTKYGKLFIYCGDESGDYVGTTVAQVAQIMKDFGCVNAMQFEAFDSPDLHINKQKTVTNLLAAQGKPKKMQCAIAFK